MDLDVKDYGISAPAYLTPAAVCRDDDLATVDIAVKINGTDLDPVHATVSTAAAGGSCANATEDAPGEFTFVCEMPVGTNVVTFSAAKDGGCSLIANRRFLQLAC